MPFPLLNLANKSTEASHVHPSDLSHDFTNNKQVTPPPLVILEIQGLKFLKGGLIASGAYGNVYFASLIHDSDRPVCQLALKVVKVVKVILREEAEKAAEPPEDIAQDSADIILEEIEKMRHLPDGIAPNISAMGLIKGPRFDGQQGILMDAYKEDLYFYSSSALKAGIDKSYLENSVVIMKQAVALLSRLHENGFVHGDFKPKNIVYNEEGDVRIIDYGTLFKGAREDYSELTYKYIPPESITRLYDKACSSVDRSLDIWSFGISLAEVLFFEPIFYKTGSPFRTYIRNVLRLLGKPPGEFISINNGRELLYFRDFKRGLACKKEPLKKYSETRSTEAVKDVLKELIRNRLKDLKIVLDDEAQISGQSSKDFIENLADLLSKIFRWKPAERLTAEQMLEHPFFRESVRSQL